MLLTLIFYNTLLVPIVFGSSTTIPDDHSLALHLLTKETPKVEPDAAKLNLTIITEGGSVAPSSPPPSTPKNEHAILLTLDKELSKDKTVGSSDSKVKPRKGVVYHVDNETVPEDNSQKNPKKNSLTDLDIRVLFDAHSTKHNLTEKHSSPHTIKHNLTEKPSSLSEVEVSTTPKFLNHTLPAQKQKVNRTLHLKPKILSNEALDTIVFSNKDEKLSTVGSLAKTVVTDQIPSPDGRSKQIESVHSRHPGLVMPVVITILVVPMFAVLGYMALKRGREAWKNRHYKRMDFLLDGMYNE